MDNSNADRLNMDTISFWFCADKFHKNCVIIQLVGFNSDECNESNIRNSIISMGIFPTLPMLEILGEK